MADAHATPGPRDAPALLRLFFALWPNASARDALAVLARGTAAQTRGRATSPENLHLTLAFLGDVAATRIAALDTIGLAVAAAVSSFTLTLDRVGAFRDAGIVWAGTSTTPPALVRLAQLLSEGLATQGFPAERRAFHAHLTLARRCRRPVSVPIAAPIAWTVERLTLNASELASDGARYRELAGWSLDPRANVR